MALCRPFLAGGHDVVSEEAEPTKHCECGSFDVERTEERSFEVTQPKSESTANSSLKLAATAW